MIQNRSFYFILLFLALPLSAEPLSENQARLGAITGDVGLLTQGAPEWIEPHEGLPLEPGDEIRTGEDGHAELVMSQNVLWSLEPETDVVTEHMDTNSGRLNLSEGALLGRVDSSRMAGIEQKWEINSPMAVISIRGTEFALEFSKPPESRLGVFEGNVDVQPAETEAGLPDAIQVPAGQQASVKQGRAIQKGPFTARMKLFQGKFPILRRRHAQIQNTWSPFTPSVRTDLRNKFVSPAKKRKPPRRPPALRRRRVQTPEENSY